MTTTFGVTQDEYLRKMVAANAILINAIRDIQDEANRYESYFSQRVHIMAQLAIDRVTLL